MWQGQARERTVGADEQVDEEGRVVSHGVAELAALVAEPPQQVCREVAGAAEQQMRRPPL